MCGRPYASWRYATHTHGPPGAARRGGGRRARRAPKASATQIEPAPVFWCVFGHRWALKINAVSPPLPPPHTPTGGVGLRFSRQSRAHTECQVGKTCVSPSGAALISGPGRTTHLPGSADPHPSPPGSWGGEKGARQGETREGKKERAWNVQVRKHTHRGNDFWLKKHTNRP